MNYKSEADAMLINGTVKKKDCTNDSLLCYFKSGVNREGYWNSLPDKLQLEDVHDCLTVLYPAFDFMFLYGQLAGYTKTRADSLIPSNVNVIFGGVATTMYDTKILEVGPYTAPLKVGCTQLMFFCESDMGPF